MVTLTWKRGRGPCELRKGRIKLPSLLVPDRGRSRASDTSARCHGRLRAGHGRDCPVRGRMLGRSPGCGRFADEFAVLDGGCPQRQNLGVPIPERIPLRVSHAFDDHPVRQVHADATGTDLLISSGRVRRINPCRWFRYGRQWVGWRLRHRPPEPQPRPESSARAAPAVPHSRMDFGRLAARRPCGDDRSGNDARAGVTCEGNGSARKAERTQGFRMGRSVIDRKARPRGFCPCWRCAVSP
jgi:hypothetical protein